MNNRREFFKKIGLGVMAVAIGLNLMAAYTKPEPEKLITQPEEKVSVGDEPQSVYDFPVTVKLPAVLNGNPGAGKRVRMTTPDWTETSVYHTLYLPKDWNRNAKLPVIVEYAGNGGYIKGLDVSHGTVEDCCLGYGLTSGSGAIWITMPFVEVKNGLKQNCTVWWGDIEETKRYCTETVRDVCEQFGGDPNRVILAGFSRGAIACFYIGLHDDQIAGLWSGFFCHSHLDGVRENWGYPGADRASALIRLKRLGNRPVWISQENTTDDIQQYLKETGVTGRFTFASLPYPNHTIQWILRDLPIRLEAINWWNSKNIQAQHRYENDFKTVEII
ncbi:hypothetical protein AGMMS50239_28340 [Bacteroidia bacterium]|nr:hypothetical protein AGMMS50239_28340 [Bacteroidia bacterium]